MSAKKLTLTVDVPAKALIRSLMSDVSGETLIDLIKEIDANRAEWEFTLTLCRYFEKQRKLYDSEVATDKEGGKP